MKFFKFFAKQNQHQDIADILVAEFKVAPSIEKVDGGFVVSCYHNTSNRRINKILFDYNIPGAVKPKNLPVSKVDNAWDAFQKFGYDPFVQSFHNGIKRILRKVRVVRIDPGCTCCSPYLNIETV